jgi:cytochrome c peroxidase
MTQKEEDKYVFRVPMLRNIARTGPYFHDGSVQTLERAVQVMGAVQLGRTLDAATVASIVAFLESLSGNVPAHYAPPGARAQDRY